MPVFEFCCNDCKNTYEDYFTSPRPWEGESAIYDSVCPVCGSDDVKKLISKCSFHLKGTGWAKDLYSKSG